MNQIVNNIWLTWKLTYILRTYRICNLIVRFSKNEINNKLLGGVILFRVIPSKTWIQPIYIYIYRERERERERERGRERERWVQITLGVTLVELHLLYTIDSY